MATAFLSPIFSASTHIQPVTSENCQSIIRNGLSKSAFLFGNSDFAASTTLCSSSLQGKAAVSRKFKICAYKSSFDHIPKQFRQENLKDGVMENFNNVPQYLYGLSPEQMEMFMTEDNPVNRQSMNVTEESISSARSYLDNAPMSRCSMRTSMSRSRARGYGRRAPPNLSSRILDCRVVYLGLPIFRAVTKFIIAQFMWLDYDNPSKPIYLYINSPGTQNEKMQTVASDSNAYAIADCMACCKSKAKELEANTEIFIEFLSEGTGKPKEEIARDLQRPKFMTPQEAIDYGIADKIIYSMENTYEKRNYDEMLAQSKAMWKGGPRVQGAPSGSL